MNPSPHKHTQNLRRSSSFPSGAQAESLLQYLSSIKHIPLLSPTQEQELAVLSIQGDKSSTEKLIQSNLRLVVKIALQYQSPRVSFMDLIQEGNLGLIQAIKKFDPSRSIRLSSYAQWWIRAFILKFLIDNHHLIKIGTTQAQRRLFYNLQKTREQLQRDGLDPSPENIAALLRVRPQDVQDMDIRLNLGEVSLDAPLRQDDDNTSLLDLIPLPSTPSDQLCAQHEIATILSKKLQEFRQTLRGRDVDIWDHRLTCDEPLTLQEIGDSFGVSRERARQLDVRIKNKLTKFLKKTIKEINPLDSDAPLFL